MYKRQRETNLQNFKTDESLNVFLKTITDSAHLSCTGRLFHRTAVAVSHSLRPYFTVFSYLALMMGRQQIGEDLLGGTSRACHICVASLQKGPHVATK